MDARMTRRRFLKLTAGLAVLGVTGDLAYVEPHRIRVTRHDVPMRKLPRKLDGFTIVQMSDLHRSMIVPDSLISTAARLANDVSADIAVFTGDFVSHNSRNADACAEMLSAIKPRLGCYAVLGNHDYWTDAKYVAKSLENHGIRVLKNENTLLSPGLTLLGLDDWWAGHPNVQNTWKGVDDDTAQVLLCHNPLAVKAMHGRECLMLTGHTHGGQVHIPFVPRNHLPGLKGWRYIQGWYQVGDVRMYVNRGIGMIFPPVRFMCSPEITVYTLRSST